MRHPVADKKTARQQYADSGGYDSDSEFPIHALNVPPAHSVKFDIGTLAQMGINVKLLRFFKTLCQ